jgi:hypothetical protein
MLGTLLPVTGPFGSKTVSPPPCPTLMLLRWGPIGALCYEFPALPLEIQYDKLALKTAISLCRFICCAYDSGPANVSSFLSLRRSKGRNSRKIKTLICLLSGRRPKHRLSPVQQVRAPVVGTVSAIRADALVTSRRNIRLWRIVQTSHSHVANLRVLEFRFALRTDENPFGHCHPRCGDSQKAGEHPALYGTVPTKSRKDNRVFPVIADAG